MATRSRLLLMAPWLLLLAACSTDRAAEAPPAQASRTTQGASTLELAATRMLVKNASLEIQVDDTVAAARAVQQLAATHAGHVSSMDARRVGELLHYSITLRVPAERLDELLAAIKDLARAIDREHLSSRDVTEEYVDLEARLVTLEATETELRGLLAESRARKADAQQIMAVYRELTEIRSRIEQTRGKLVVLENLAALSTVQLEIRPTDVAKPLARSGWQPSATLRSSARALVSVLQGLVDLAIVLVVVVLPVLLLVGVPVWFVGRAVARWRGRRRS